MTEPARTWRDVLRDYVQLSKLRIAVLLLVVAWSAMFVASGGLPPGLPFAAVTAAGLLSTAAAGAFNHVVERERDAVMVRTANRPVAEGRVSVAAAVTFGVVTGLLSVAALAALEAWLAAALTVGAIAYYVLVYTVALKPTTPQNIVIGGFAGSFPALIGWAAVTGTVGWPAWALAGLVFLWTPAHFWALALLYKDDYAEAKYPMMPNVRGEASTRRQIVFYSAATVLLSLALATPVLGHAGLIYLAVAAFLGGVLLVRAVRLLSDHAPARYRTFFLYTIQYLGVLCIALMVDQVIPATPRLPW